MIFLVLFPRSATGLSLGCSYYKALKLGEASRVAPIDKTKRGPSGGDGFSLSWARRPTTGKRAGGDPSDGRRVGSGVRCVKAGRSAEVIVALVFQGNSAGLPEDQTNAELLVLLSRSKRNSKGLLDQACSAEARAASSIFCKYYSGRYGYRVHCGGGAFDGHPRKCLRRWLRRRMIMPHLRGSPSPSALPP